MFGLVLIGTNLETGLPFFVTTISSPELATSSIKPKHRALNTDALIFVVDSSDTERMELAKEELHAILNDEEM